jgi:phthiodiolone/phenolphthiodiolone dimycocerosates ketoreductase
VRVGSMLPCVHSLQLNTMALDAVVALGLDSVWLPDHMIGFVHPALWPEFPAAAGLPDPDAFLDPFVLAAALGTKTTLSLGTCVTDATRRRGVDHARTALSLHDACEGGFILGIGAGEAESLVPFGYDYSRPAGNLERALKELRAILDDGHLPGEPEARTGLDRTNGIPQVWVAAQGGRSLRLAGRHGDGWLTVEPDPARYEANRQVVLDAANDASRPMPIQAMFPVTILGESRAAVLDLLESNPLVKLVALWADGADWARHGLVHPSGADIRGRQMIPHALDPARLRRLAPRIPVELVEDFVFIGNAEEIAERIEPYAKAGLEHLVLADFTGIAQPPEAMPTAAAQLGKLAALLHAWD